LSPIATENGVFDFPYIHAPAYFDTDLTLLKNFSIRDGKNVQFRFAGFNIFNHSITSFSGRFPAEASLYYTGTTPPELSTPTSGCSAVNSACFGYAGYKQGRRVVELAAKLSF
jgi:hypothetical protein